MLKKFQWKIRKGGEYLRDRIRSEENMNIHLREIGFDGVNLTYVFKDRFLCLNL